MIIIYHKSYDVVHIYDAEKAVEIPFLKGGIVNHLFEIAGNYPGRLLIWCENSISDALNVDEISNIFHHKKMIASYNPNGNFLPEAIGYIEESAFIKVPKDVKFPTWRMSSFVGGIDSSLLLLLEKLINKDDNFDYLLNSISKLAMPLGLFCFSEPALLKEKVNGVTVPANYTDLFRFAKQHYKSVWTFALMLNLIIYERKFPLAALFYSLFFRRRKFDATTLNSVPVKSKKSNPYNKSVDVLIPTIGRKEHLYNILKDLSSQTFLPAKVIISEQNPLPGSSTELDYLTMEKWPFEVKHIFTNQPGACNARNLALAEVSADWMFFADDDIRIGNNFLEDIFKRIYEINDDVYNISIINPGQQRKYETIHQTSIFGGSCSIISRKSLGRTNFDMAFEFGFGEDVDFGRQLMNKGYAINYLPDPVIDHLKAPSGGFRTKLKLMWDDDPVLPKPAPTILLFRSENQTKEQLNGYKTTLFFKYYGNQREKNPFKYYQSFKIKWNRSIFWAKKLRELNPKADTATTHS